MRRRRPAGNSRPDPAAVRRPAEKILASGSARVVVKSQIHAGGRGKGTFKTGFKAASRSPARRRKPVSLAGKMLGNVLVTKQTGPDGRRVQPAAASPKRRKD